MSKNQNNKRVKVTLTKSLIGRLKKHKQCALGLGLRRIGQTVDVEDTPSNRGMIHHIDYLVVVED